MTVPDLDERSIVESESVRLAPPADGAGAWTVLPRALRLSDRPDGSPDLHLELVRSAAVRLAGYAVLDARVDAAPDLDAAAALLAARDPDAVVRPPAWTDGALVVSPLVGGTAQVQPLGDAGTGPVRAGLRLTAEQAQLADALLVDGALPVRIVAHREVLGVPRRLPVRVSFAPRDLLDGLRDAVHTLVDLAERFAADWKRHRDGGTSPFRDVDRELDAVPPDDVGRALALRVRATYGVFAVDPASPDSAATRLRPYDPGEPVVDHVDLGATVAVPCPVTLPLVADGALAERLRGRDDLRGTTDVPSLGTGFHAVTVLGNLPPDREGTFGVRLQKAATPDRPLPVDQSAALRPPEDRASVLVRLAPTESSELSARPFVYVDDHGTGVARRIDGVARPSDGASMLLGPGAFPVRMVSLTATAPLLAEVALEIDVAWSGDGRSGTRTVVLGPDRPSRTIVLPAGAEVGPVDVTARTDDGRVEPLRFDSAPDTALDRHLFPYFGANALEVRCVPGPDRGSRTVDFLPERASEDDVVVLVFDDDRPTRTLRWFNPSVVRAGVRYRPHRVDGPPEPWSEPHPPDRPLDLPAENPARP